MKRESLFPFNSFLFVVYTKILYNKVHEQNGLIITLENPKFNQN